jgi:hypothetical protein
MHTLWMIGETTQTAGADDASLASDETLGSVVDAGVTDAQEPGQVVARAALPLEIGGRDGPEPTRFGDWEKNGRCIDF